MKAISAVIILLLISGCATNVQPLTPLLDKAQLVAYNDTFGKSFIPLQTELSSRFEEVNGNKASDFFNSEKTLILNPGEHSLVVSCRIDRLNLSLHNKVQIKQYFSAGKVYIFKPVMANRKTCDVIVEES